jgi:hypothetical protein
MERNEINILFLPTRRSYGTKLLSSSLRDVWLVEKRKKPITFHWNVWLIVSPSSHRVLLPGGRWIECKGRGWVANMQYDDIKNQICASDCPLLPHALLHAYL